MSRTNVGVGHKVGESQQQLTVLGSDLSVNSPCNFRATMHEDKTVSDAGQTHT